MEAIGFLWWTSHDFCEPNIYDVFSRPGSPGRDVPRPRYQIRVAPAHLTPVPVCEVAPGAADRQRAGRRARGGARGGTAPNGDLNMIADRIDKNAAAGNEVWDNGNRSGKLRR